jgi:bacterioferritin (cytochrome b1)
MENKSVHELNTILKGEHMAVDAYEKFIKGADNEDIRKELESFQLDHRQHIEQLSERIMELGGHPETGTGIAGVFSNAKLAIGTMNADSTDILRKAYDGEDQGIAAVEKINKCDMDDKSRILVDDILSQDHDHLKKMAHMLAFYEERQ